MPLENTRDTELTNFFKFLFSIKGLAKEEFNQKVTVYLDGLFTNPIARPEIARQIGSVFYTNSLTDAGINSNLGFFPELRQRIKHRILPPLNEDNFFSNFISRAFYKKENYTAFEKLSDENWNRIFNIIEEDNLTAVVLKGQLENALIILAHRLVTIGIDPYIVRKMPDTDDSDSPFFKLNVLINEYVKANQAIDVNTIFESIQICESLFDHIKENRATLGISLQLTFLIRRAEQHITRIRLLLQIHVTKKRIEKNRFIKELVLVVTRSEIYSTGIRHFISENTSLLANRIANQTSAKGGNYIGFTKKENNKLLVSAMGGGLVVVFLVYIKQFIHQLHLPLLPEGILFGLNYGLGFVFMHFTHLTLATKQPAMTASYIAESIEQKGISRASRKELSVILAQIMRSQFISLIGNLVVVLPLCFLSAWLLVKFGSHHVFNEMETFMQLKANHPLLSGSVFFAVFTGVFLTLAGLITGYYDNKIIFSAIPKRVLQHPILKKVIPPKWLKKIVDLIAINSGAVIGNLSLGLFLGLAGNLGKFIGIPFDIRHITISAGNFGIAVAQGYSHTQTFVILVFLGVVLIGVINIISSFLFSFLIACRSRYLTNRQTWMVLMSMVAYIFKNPAILIFRRRKEVLDKSEQG